MIKSCDQLTQPSTLSKIRHKEASPSAKAVAEALSDFLKKPTQTTQQTLAITMEKNPTYIETPVLQTLVQKAKEYYVEVGEMPADHEDVHIKNAASYNTFR